MVECRRLTSRRSSEALNVCFRFTELASTHCPTSRAITFAFKRDCRSVTARQHKGPIRFERLATNAVDKAPGSPSKLTLKGSLVDQFKRLNNKGVMDTNWVRKYLERKNKDVRERTKELERRNDNAANYYKELDEKYSFRKMDRRQLTDRLKRLNAGRRRDSALEETVVSPKVQSQVKSLHKNIKATKTKFKLIEKYQQTIQALARQTYELNFASRYDERMLKLLKTDRYVIEQFNRASYKFPLCTTRESNRQPRQFNVNFFKSMKERKAPAH